MRLDPIATPATLPISGRSLPAPIGMAALVGLAFNNADLAPLHAALTARCNDTGNPSLLLDLSTLEMVRGNAEAARERQMQALAGCRLFHRMSTARSGGVRLLAVMGSGGLMANTPVELLLEHSDIRLEMAYCRPGEGLPAALPAHDALFVAIGESDEHRVTLEILTAQLAHWPAPVLNRPEAILRLGRHEAAALLRGARGMIVPRVERTTRDAFVAAYADLAAAPGAGGTADRAVLARPAHSHAGHGLQRLTTRAEAARYLAQREETEFYLSEYVDYRSTDGWFRKYRIAFIGGVAYPAHLAISDRWMIHYLNAGMTESAAKRAEEAQWMAQFDTAFAPRHRAAFADLAARVGLDYFVIDCGETRDGALLPFEVDAAMLVHALDHPSLFGYKQAPMHRLFRDFEAFISTSGSSQLHQMEMRRPAPINDEGAMQRIA
jgi:hypothetical protein